MDSFRISDTNPQGYREITIEGQQGPSPSLPVKNVASLSWLESLELKASGLLKSVVTINFHNQELVVRVSDIKNVLHIPDAAIMEADSNHHLTELIEEGFECASHHIPYSVFEQYKQENRLDQFRLLESLSFSEAIPLSELINADRGGYLQEYLQAEQEMETRCDAMLVNLDQLYQEAEGKLVTKDRDERIIQRMSLEELDSIKKVIKSTYKTVMRSPIQTEVQEQVFHVGHNYRIVVDASKEDVKITTLFGKLLGEGSYGVALRPIDLLEGQWGTDESAVLKLSKATDTDSEQLIQEATILSKIHAKGLVLGIQKPLKLVKDVLSGSSQYCHLGHLHQGDLQSVISNPEKQATLKLEDRLSIAYQLSHGITEMHRQHVTHGDIKGPNIFFDSHDPEGIGPHVFVADHGGGIDHTSENVPFQLSKTDIYRREQDDMASRSAHRQKNMALYEEIEKSADVFATCSTFCSLFTGEMPYEGKDLIVNSKLGQKLMDSGLSEETVDLLVKGLDIDYSQRPDMATITHSIIKDLETVAPERAAILRNLSLEDSSDTTSESSSTFSGGSISSQSM
jgi:hypothetical protein